MAKNVLTASPFWQRIAAVERNPLPSPFGIDPTNVEYAKDAGKAIEPSEVQAWIRRLGPGFQVHTQHAFPAWLARLFPNASSRPDMVAIHPARKQILVGDVTAQPRTDHLRKTMRYAQRIANALAPNNTYSVLFQERYWGTPIDRARRIGMGGNVSPRFVLRRPQREFESGEFFDIEKGVAGWPLYTPPGHEVLTRNAASGITGISATDVTNLVEGVRRVDLQLQSHVMPSHQRRHSLRQEKTQTTVAALTQIRSHLALVHGQALGMFRSSNRAEGFRLLGESLHLIQDSFSQAHTERDWSAWPSGPFPIVYVKAYLVFGPHAPTEHGFPTDPLDQIAPGGSLRGEAWASQQASYEYLMLALRHSALPPTDPRISSELVAFAKRHLPLSPSHR